MNKENKDVIDKRIGTFYASTKIVSTGKIFPVLALMKFVPLRVECIWHKNMFSMKSSKRMNSMMIMIIS